MPTVPVAKQAGVSADRLFAGDLEILSKRWGIALVAERPPFR